MGIFSKRIEQRSDAPGPSDPSTAFAIPTRGDISPRAVSTGDALSLSMVFRAIQIHATAVSQMSVDAYRDGEQLPVPPMFIRRPDVNSTRPAFFEETAVSLAATGNAYWLVTRDDQNRVTNLEILNPLDVEIQATQWGRVTGYQYKGAIYAPHEVQHLKYLRTPGALKGLGPIQAAQQELRGAIDTRNYASEWFDKSGVPSGTLTSDQHLTPENAKAYKDAWTAGMADNKGVAVLGQGLSYTPIYLSPKDAQFLESQSFNVTQIARLFGVPASLMLATVEGNSQSYANVEQDWLAYYRFTLIKFTREIETALTELLPRGTEARFNFEALLRADTTSRYAAHSLALTAGFMSINEVRAIENLPPIPGGDHKTPEEKAAEAAQFAPKADDSEEDQKEAPSE